MDISGMVGTLVSQESAAVEKYLLDCFGSVENARRYGAQFKLVSTPTVFEQGEDGSYHASSTYRLERRERTISG